MVLHNYRVCLHMISRLIYTTFFVIRREDVAAFILHISELTTEVHMARKDGAKNQK